jgi:hypothetical membrane protein
MEDLKRSGLLFFLAGSLTLMGITTAEAVYPSAYSSHNEISDLGATRPPNSVSYQPAAGIFNVTMALAGFMVLMAAGLQHTHFKKLLFSIPLFLFGLGLVGVGCFPGNLSPYHGLFSMLALLAGGVSAIASGKVVTAPFNYIGIALGAVALITWGLAAFSPAFLLSVIGIGGTERWVAYPILLWLTALGGYLLNRTTRQPKLFGQS